MLRFHKYHGKFLLNLCLWAATGFLVMRPPHEERKIMELNSDQTNIYNYGIDAIISRQAFHKKSVCRSQAITLQIEEESRPKVTPPMYCWTPGKLLSYYYYYYCCWHSHQLSVQTIAKKCGETIRFSQESEKAVQ